MPDNVLILLGPATLLAQTAVNLVRMSYPPGQPAPWVSPVLAVLFGIAGSLLLLLVGEMGLSAANVATAIVAGVFAGAGAVGVTELTRRAT
jgi:hypothetical protein